MSATNFTPIQLYRTSTAAAVPTAGNLAAGELAINLTDERLYFKNAAGVVKLLASNSGSLGTVTSVDVSGGTTGLTTSGGPITSSGTITLGGTLGVANGGTGTATAFTAGSVVFAGASGVYSQDNANFFWDNANDRLGIGINTPAIKLQVSDVDQATARIGVRNANGQNYHLVAGTPGASNTGFAIFDATASATRMYISSAGDVGIGTSSPADKLHVSATGTLYGSGYIVSRHMNAVSEKGVFLGYDADENAGTIGGANFLTFQTYNAANAWGERMRIDREGRVGIGTTSPTFPLCVSANSGTDVALVSAIAGGAYFGAVGVKPVIFQNNDLERMRIDGAGNVGIGTSAPSARLSVSKGSTGLIASISDGIAQTLQVSSGSGYIGFLNPNYGAITFRDPTDVSEFMRVTNVGNVGIGTSSPSTKLDVVGTINASDGTNGNIRAYVDGTSAYLQSLNQAANAYRPLLVMGSTVSFANNGVTNVTIDTSGRLLIGQTTNPNNFYLIANTGSASNNNAALFTNAVDADLSIKLTSGVSLLSPSTGVLAFGTSNTERMRIDSSGNVGIGTSSPTGRLELGQTTTVDPALQITATSGINPRITFTDPFGSAAIASGGGVIFLRTGGTATAQNKVTILANGNVGVGDLYGSPPERLSVNGNIRLGSTNSVFWGGTANYITGSNASNFLALGTNSTERMRIDSAGRVGIGTTTPGVYPYGAALNVEGSISMALDQRMGWGITDAFTLNGVTTAQYGFTYGGGTNLVTSSGYYGLNFSTLSAERMRITTGGNVLVGTTAASTGSKVQVRANYSAGEFYSAYCALPSGTSGGGGLTMGAIAIDNAQIASGSEYNSAGLHYAFDTTASNISLISGVISFFTNSGLTAATTFTPTERMRIDTSGDLLIGTTTSNGRLNVVRANTAAASIFIEATSGTNPYVVFKDSFGSSAIAGGSGDLIFRAGGTGVGDVKMTVDGATGNVGIGISSPDASAKLQISSTTSGFRPPSMTTTQRDAIASPINGLILYNNTTNKLQVRAAGAWVDLH
jgi:hypothetical protein